MTTDPSRDAFEKWKKDYELSSEPNYSPATEYDCAAAYESGWQSAMAHKEADAWQPIATAPRDKTVLLGYRNSHDHWRTLRGEWFSKEEIDELWEDPKGVEPGWFETSVEADDVPNVWRTAPTHWRSLPAAPKQEGGT